VENGKECPGVFVTKQFSFFLKFFFVITTSAEIELHWGLARNDLCHTISLLKVY
jgi:hypothetical protein